MRHTFRAAAAVAALLAAPALAHAGPLQWGFRATAADGTVLRELAGITELRWSDFFMPDPKLYGAPIPDPRPGTGYHTDVWRTSATVTIIDEASGCTGALPLHLDFIQEYAVDSGGARELIYEGYQSNAWPGATVFTLGDNKYRVRAPGGELLVDVTPGATTATPEPGSLALAGFGLAAVFALRLRRPGKDDTARGGCAV